MGGPGEWFAFGRCLVWRVVAGAAVLVALAGGLWLVTLLDVSAGPQSSEPPPETEPAPVRVVVVPPKVTQGSAGTVRVTAACPPGDVTATAASDAFSVATALETALPSGGVSGEVEVDGTLPPGRYAVTVACPRKDVFGTADLVVTPARTRPSGPRRAATTSITLAKAAQGAWRDHPKAPQAYIDPGAGGAEVVEVRVTQRLRVPVDDPDVAAVRAGVAGRMATQLAGKRIGDVGLEPQLLSVEFGVPVVTVEPGSRKAVVTFTGVGYAISYPGRFVGLEFDPVDGEEHAPPDQEVTIAATGWTVAGVHGARPLTQDRHDLRLAGGPAKVAFTRDGATAFVAGYLAGDRRVGAHLEGGDDLLDVEGAESQEDLEAREEAGTSGSPDISGADVLVRGWITLEAVLWLVAGLVLGVTLVRALGGAWWRRSRNRLLLAMVGAGYGGLVVSALGPLGFGSLFLDDPDVAIWPLAAILGVGLPVLSLYSAARAVPGGGVVLRAAGCAAACAAGAMLMLWSLLVLDAGTPVLAWSAAVAVTAISVAVFRSWRPALPGAALLVLGTGVLLAGRAMAGGIRPGALLWLGLFAVGLSVLAFGWVTEAGRTWASRIAVRCFVAVFAVFVVLANAVFTGDQLGSVVAAAGSSIRDMLPFLFFGLPVVAVIALVVRVARAGRGPDGLTSASALSTAVFIVVALRAQATANVEVMGVTMLLAWAGMLWLVPAAAHGSTAHKPVNEGLHRVLVRDLIRRRSARAALTDLLRRERGEGFEERRAELERAADESAGPVDSDLALATLAGRTPWQNGLAALRMGALLSLPFSAVRIVASIENPRTGGTELLVASLALVSMPVLCMVFGYFYPRVRGRDPIAKALSLLIAALLIELPLYVQTLVVATTQDASLSLTPLPTTSEALVGVLVAVGNIAVVSIGLGLWWEWRLMSLAGEPWARIRNLRSLRALAAPLAAVTLAVGTTTATALVNNVIAPLPTAAVTENSPPPGQ